MVGNYQEIDEPALIPHIAEASSSKYPYEVLFRSLHKLLMDTATSEYCGVCLAPSCCFRNDDCLSCSDKRFDIFLSSAGIISVMISLLRSPYFTKFLQVTLM
jgi:hypothetical protein